jgi:hypothetical protein
MSYIHNSWNLLVSIENPIICALYENKLISCDVYSGMAPGEEKTQKFSSLFSQLPTANYDTLKALFIHLNK